MMASDQLERILYMLPAAARDGGVPLAELADALNADVETILDDIELVTARAYYHPGGTVEPFTILVESDRVEVHAASEFKRPVRLSAPEALALGLGLRTLAAESEEPRRSEIMALAERLEHELTAPIVETQPRLQETQVRASAQEYRTSVVDIALSDDDYRGLLSAAIENGSVCRIDYLRPGGLDAVTRKIAPVTLLYSNGRWYVAAFDLDRAAPRLFRLDRVLSVTQSAERISSERAANVRDHIAELETAYSAEEEVEVTVRYSPRIARWIREYGVVEAQDDGGVRVRYQVADAHWLIRHVMQYGGEAVVETQPYRALVAKAAAQLGA